MSRLLRHTDEDNYLNTIPQDYWMLQMQQSTCDLYHTCICSGKKAVPSSCSPKSIKGLGCMVPPLGAMGLTPGGPPTPIPAKPLGPD